MEPAHPLEQVHDPPEPAPSFRVEGLRGWDFAWVREDCTQKEPDVAVRGVERAEGCRHTLVAWEPGTVIFACKQGPDRPLEDKDFQPGFPLEGRWRPGSWSWSGDSCWMETFCA
jgi:hypothetical protein